jgi:hypothetical protein
VDFCFLLSQFLIFRTEASRARLNEEFFSKLGGALQEADETLLWLELLREGCFPERCL